jgi:hypothetical protein
MAEFGRLINDVSCVLCLLVAVSLSPACARPWHMVIFCRQPIRAPAHSLSEVKHPLWARVRAHRSVGRGSPLRSTLGSASPGPWGLLFCASSAGSGGARQTHRHCHSRCLSSCRSLQRCTGKARCAARAKQARALVSAAVAQKPLAQQLRGLRSRAIAQDAVGLPRGHCRATALAKAWGAVARRQARPNPGAHARCCRCRRKKKVRNGIKEHRKRSWPPSSWAPSPRQVGTSAYFSLLGQRAQSSLSHWTHHGSLPARA